MTPQLEFVLTMLAVVALWGLWELRHEILTEYFKTRDGKGILKGIVMVIALGVIVALLSGCVNSASFYAGLEEPSSNSPMCEIDGSQATSNVGFRANVYQNGPFIAHANYTHHSCAFGLDAESYDSFGVQLEYEFWRRKR